MLPHSVIIKGRVLRAIGDGTLQTLQRGVYLNIAREPSFAAARDRLVAEQRANLQKIKAA